MSSFADTLVSPASVSEVVSAHQYSGNKSGSNYMSSFADTVVSPASVSAVVSPHEYSGNNSGSNHGIVSANNTGHSSQCTFYSGFPLDSDDGQVVCNRNISELYERDTPPPSGINTPQLNVQNYNSVTHQPLHSEKGQEISENGLSHPSEPQSEHANQFLEQQNYMLAEVPITSPNAGININYCPAPNQTYPAANNNAGHAGEISNPAIVQQTPCPSDALSVDFMPDFISQPESDQQSGLCMTPRRLLQHFQNNIQQDSTTQPILERNDDMLHNGQEGAGNADANVFDPYLNGLGADVNHSFNVHPGDNVVGFRQEFNEARNQDHLSLPQQEPDAFDVSHLMNQTKQKDQSTTSDIPDTQEKESHSEKANSSLTSSQNIHGNSQKKIEPVGKDYKNNPTSETGTNEPTSDSNKKRRKKVPNQQTPDSSIVQADLSYPSNRTRSKTRSSSRKRTQASGAKSASPHLKERSRSRAKTPVSQGGARAKNSAAGTSKKETVSPAPETVTKPHTQAASPKKKKKGPNLKNKNPAPAKSYAVSPTTSKKRGRKRQAERVDGKSDTENEDTEAEEQPEVDEEDEGQQVADAKTHPQSIASRLKKLIKRTP